MAVEWRGVGGNEGWHHGVRCSGSNGLDMCG